MRLGMISRMRSRSRLTRVIRHCVAVVLLGLLATILSAWASAWIAPAANRSIQFGYPKGQAWTLSVPDSWPANPRGKMYFAPQIDIIEGSGPVIPPKTVRYRVRESLSTGSSRSPANVWTFLNGEDPRYATDSVYIGWPLHSMTHRGPTDARPIPKNSLFQLVHSGIPVPEIKWLGFKSNRSLPLMPLWKPFLLSMVIYSLLIESLFQLYLTRGRFRRRKWRMNGSCLACGYVMEGLATCPECGSEASGNAGTGDG